MNTETRIKISKYMSCLLRHNPENLKIDGEGFVQLNDLLFKLKLKYPRADHNLLVKIANKSDKKRFEIKGNKIRALYGHSIDVNQVLIEENQITFLYHGTTNETIDEILKKGLQPMGRQFVHLSPTKEIAFEVGRRRTKNPKILSIDVARAREDGIKFYKATDKIILCRQIPAKYIGKFN